MATPPRTRVLLIDDDEALCGLLAEYLEPFGFAVASAHHPDDGLAAIAKDPPDIVVLDVMMPDTDGFAVCRKVRETSGVPIVMLTARGGVLDRIVGLEMGADDYLPKPFEPRELVARLQAVLRRAPHRGHAEMLRAGALEVDPGARAARLEGRPLDLTAAEFALLGLFLRSRSVVLSRDRILEATRGLDWEAFDRSVDVLVSRLRQKLGDDPRQPTFIKTVRGAGYCFIGDGA
jgi:DNA-binding response OmpR family regulator